MIYGTELRRPKVQNEPDLTNDLRIKKLEEIVIQLEQEITLLRADFELVKNEGCWLSKQTADHLHGGHSHE